MAPESAGAARTNGLYQSRPLIQRGCRLHVKACSSSEQEVESCHKCWEKVAAETCQSTKAKAKAAHAILLSCCMLVG
eukprot:3451301-Rhodomonas_salina.1